MFQYFLKELLFARAPRLFTGIGFGIALITWLYRRHGDQLPAVLQYSFLFGKCKPVSTPKLDVIRVPKSWFTLFYLVGAVCTLVAVFSELGEPARQPTVLCTLVLYLTHVLRRLYESLCVSVFGESQMSITHLLLGLLFYVVTPASICSSRTHAANRAPWMMACFVLSVMALQFSQHVVFRQLASLRRQSSTNPDKSLRNKHFPPQGSMFQRITCPHYLFEMALYLTFHLFLTSFLDFVLPYDVFCARQSNMRCLVVPFLVSKSVS
ncbi:hypothetical protein AHF37_02858 [Paragonimus kellicotti]|nr:hypothetical protein AHF37_02858 [Paragonimus kellicotti]